MNSIVYYCIQYNRLHKFVCVLDNPHERTLNVMALRIREAFPLELQLLTDMDILLRLVSEQRQNQCYWDPETL